MFLAIIAGQTDCVSLINNFLSVEDLEYFTKPRGILNAADAEEDNVNVPCFLQLAFTSLGAGHSSIIMFWSVYSLWR